jgi:hypothetical protein
MATKTKANGPLTLTSYMDEAGHFDDPTKHYVGMAGFVAPAPVWEDFGKLWKAILDDFKLTRPFHMKDFAQSKGNFESGWKEDERKRRGLFAALITAIQHTKATPVAAIVSIQDFKGLTQCQRDSFVEPYHITFQMVTRGAALEAMFIEPERVDMVYSYNHEYGTVPPQETYSVDQAGDAEKLWHAMKEHTDFGKWMGSYASTTPGDALPLQAADIFAYELAKEFETLVEDKPGRKMRWGLQQILHMVAFPLHARIRLLDRIELLRLAKEGMLPCQTGTEEVSNTQIFSARDRLVRWMQERGNL